MKPDFSKLDDRNIVAFLGDIFARCSAEEYPGEPVTLAEPMFHGAVLAEAAVLGAVFSALVFFFLAFFFLVS